MLYYVVFLLFCCFAFIEIILKQPKLKYLAIFFICVSALIVISGFRKNIGYDYDNYVEMYSLNTDIWYFTVVEPSFSLLVILFNYFKLGFNALLLFFAFFAIFLKARFVLNFSPYIFFSLLVYIPLGFLTSDMGQIRHGLALAFILIAFGNLFYDRFRKFWIFLALGCFFHLSAIIVIPAYYLCKKKVSNIALLFFLVLAFPFVFLDLKTLLYTYSSFLPSQLDSKVVFYTNSDDFGKNLGINVSLMIRLSIFGLLMFFEKAASDIPYYRTILILYFYGILVYLIFNSISGFAIRGSLYFKMLELIIFPILVSFGRRWYDKIFIASFFILYTFWSIINFFSDPAVSNQYIPYNSILF